MCSFIASIRKSNKISESSRWCLFPTHFIPRKRIEGEKVQGEPKKKLETDKTSAAWHSKNSQMCRYLKFRGILTYISCMDMAYVRECTQNSLIRYSTDILRYLKLLVMNFFLQVLLSSERLQSTSSSSTGRLSASPKAGGGTGSTLSVQQMHLCRDWRCITLPLFCGDGTQRMDDARKPRKSEIGSHGIIFSFQKDI